MTTKTYIVQNDGFLLGRFYKKDAEITLTDDQAKYMAVPYGSDVVLKKPKARAEKKDA